MSERRYRQQGYQDQGSRESSGSRPGGPPRTPEGPRGRGLGAPTATTFRCATCGAECAAGAIEVESVCDSCGHALHSCRHCASFDPSARFECRQPIEAGIRSKSKGNECLLFAPRLLAENARESGPKPGNARDAFDALFRK